MLQMAFVYQTQQSLLFAQLIPFVATLLFSMRRRFCTITFKNALKLPSECMSYIPQSNRAEGKLSQEQITSPGRLAAHTCFAQTNFSSDVTSAMMQVGHVGQCRGCPGKGLGPPRSGAGLEIAQKSGREMMSPFLFTFSPSETAMSGSLTACQTKQFQEQTTATPLLPGA